MMSPSTELTRARAIRVFVSSTFRDMTRERDLLVKHVFPALRRLCDERFVSLTEVDFRWGITEEQSAEGQILPICLEEIDRCRPFFIGVLGERYGWVPSALPIDLIEAEPWLVPLVETGASVTEMEILHGALNDPERATCTLFYFRDPNYIKSLSEAEWPSMVEGVNSEEVTHLGPTEALKQSQERETKLRLLKDRIRESGLPLLDNYADPETFAESVEVQFKQVIDKLFPHEEVPDPLDQETIGQRSYALRKLLAYVDRPVHTQALNAFAVGSSAAPGLLVTGDSGSGKTALLAHWAKAWKENNPDCFVFEHYFGATPKTNERLLRNSPESSDYT